MDNHQPHDGARFRNDRHKKFGSKSHDMYQLVFDDLDDDGDSSHSPLEESEEDEQSLSPSERVMKILGSREPDIDITRWPSDNCDISCINRDSNENYEPTDLQFRYSPSLEFNLSETGSQNDNDSLGESRIEILEESETEFVKIVKTTPLGSEHSNQDPTGSPTLKSHNLLNSVWSRGQVTSNKTNNAMAVRYMKPTFIENDDSYIDDEIPSYPANNDDAVGGGQDNDETVFPDEIELHYDDNAALDLPSIDTESWSHHQTNEDDDLQPIIFMNESINEDHQRQRWSQKHRKLLIGIGAIVAIFMLAAFIAIIFFLVKVFT